MRTNRGLWRPGRASAAEQYGGIVRLRFRRWGGAFRAGGQHVAEPAIALRECDAMALLLLPQQREEQRLQARQVFLDVRRNHAANRRASLDGLHAIVQASEDQRDPGARFA